TAASTAIPAFTGVAAFAAAVAPVHARATGAAATTLVAGCVERQFAFAVDLAFADPALDADLAVDGLGLLQRIVDIGAEGVERRTAVLVFFRPRDLRPVESSAD